MDPISQQKVDPQPSGLQPAPSQRGGSNLIAKLRSRLKLSMSSLPKLKLGRNDLVLIGAIILSIIGLLTLIVIDHNAKLATASYKNEAGTKFNLVYYRHSQTLPASQLSATRGEQVPNWLLLRAPLPNNPNLAMAIHLDQEDTANFKDIQQCQNDFRFNVAGPNHTTIPVCGLTAKNGHQAVYLAGLTMKGSGYLASIIIDFDSQKVGAGTIGSINLADYDNDIKTILASIRTK